MEHPLGDGDSCVVRRTWPASTTELEPAVLDEDGDVDTPATYAGTEPDQPTEVVDATGIASPIPLQDLGGNECVPGLPGEWVYGDYTYPLLLARGGIMVPLDFS